MRKSVCGDMALTQEIWAPPLIPATAPVLNFGDVTEGGDVVIP